MREAASAPNSAALALVAAMVENPGLMSLPRDREMKRVAAIKAEAADPDLALLRWAAARGLLLSCLFGMSPLSKAEHDRLFARLLDDKQWTGLEQPSRQRAPPNPARRRRQRPQPRASAPDSSLTNSCRSLPKVAPAAKCARTPSWHFTNQPVGFINGNTEAAQGF